MDSFQINNLSKKEFMRMLRNRFQAAATTSLAKAII
jgi:hypothetical protein